MPRLGNRSNLVGASGSIIHRRRHQARRLLLAAYRGWGHYESVFGGMPDDVVWSWARFDESVLRERVFTIKWYFEETFGTRQIIRLDVELVQTSCGYGVPLLDYKGERPSFENWARSKGEDGLRLYRAEKNMVSIDGFATGYQAEDENADETGR